MFKDSQNAPSWTDASLLSLPVASRAGHSTTPSARAIEPLLTPVFYTRRAGKRFVDLARWNPIFFTPPLIALKTDLRAK